MLVHGPSRREAAVNIPAVANPHHEDQEQRIPNLVKDPVVPATDAVEMVHSRKSLGLERAWVTRQGPQSAGYLALDLQRQSRQLGVGVFG